MVLCWCFCWCFCWQFFRVLVQGRPARHRLGVPGLRPEGERAHRGGGAARHHRQLVPRGRGLRRHVYREHHGQRDRGHGTATSASFSNIFQHFRTIPHGLYLYILLARLHMPPHDSSSAVYHTRLRVRGYRMLISMGARNPLLCPCHRAHTGHVAAQLVVDAGRLTGEGPCRVLVECAG